METIQGLQLDSSCLTRLLTIKKKLDMKMYSRRRMKKLEIIKEDLKNEIDI